MKKHTVTIAKREFPLAFTLKTFIRLQDEVEGFDFDRLNDLIRMPKGMVDVLYELAVSGAKLEGQPLDVDKDWMAERIPANIRSIRTIQAAIVGALTDYMEMESEKEADENREVDVVLEDIKKKEAKTG